MGTTNPKSPWSGSELSFRPNRRAWGWSQHLDQWERADEFTGSRLGITGSRLGIDRGLVGLALSVVANLLRPGRPVLMSPYWDR